MVALFWSILMLAVGAAFAITVAEEVSVAVSVPSVAVTVTVMLSPLTKLLLSSVSVVPVEFPLTNHS